MSLSDLKKRRRKLSRKAERRQNIRSKLRKFIRYAKKRGLKTLASRAEKVEKRLEAKIKELHAELQALDKHIAALEAVRDTHRQDFVKWLGAQVGVAEGSTLQRSWAADLGYSWTLPWCSIFAAYGLKNKGGFAGRLPVNPAYSGNWLNWAYGTRVSYSNAQPGDLIVFDWGDGGITDHVAVYVGNGLKVGGNENNRVERDSVPTANVVGVVRPNWDD